MSCVRENSVGLPLTLHVTYVVHKASFNGPNKRQK